MGGRTYGAIAVGAVIGAFAVANLVVSASSPAVPHVSKFAPSAFGAKGVETPGEGRADGWEAYLAAALAYPANQIPPAVADRGGVAFAALAANDAKKGDSKAKGHKWELFGPKEDATQPGVTAFSGATNTTASRITGSVADPSF